MQIVRIESFRLSVPLERPMRMAGRTIATSETILVRLVTTGREAGWGEANVATQLTGETAQGILDALATLEDRLVGLDARDLRQLHEIMAEAAPAATSARAAVDMALHDAVARALGISVSRLLGGRAELSAPMIALVDPSEADWLDECRMRRSQSARIIKLKVANAPLADEIRIVRAAAADLPSGHSVAVDANGGWCLEQAREFFLELGDAPIMFAEQPLPPEWVGEAAQLARESEVPLCADEAIHDDRDIVRCRTEGSAAGVSLKLIKLGGLTAVRDAAALAGGLGLAVNLLAKVGETNVANAATLHVAAAMPSPRWGVSLTAAYLAEDVVSMPIGLAGSAAVLNGPGLGVSVDENRLADLMGQVTVGGRNTVPALDGAAAP